jgi:hypothetical protein
MEAGKDVPQEQSRWLMNEIGRLVGDTEILGFYSAEVGRDPDYVFSIIGEAAYLLRWDGDNLEIIFLGELAKLKYKERGRTVGGVVGFEGEPWLRIEIEHDLLPAPMAMEASDWQLSRLRPLQLKLRSWARQA